MVKDTKFVLNKRALQSQILYGGNVDTEGALARAAGPDAIIEASSNARRGGRLRARIYGDLNDEASSGSLSRRLGGSS